MLKINNFHLLFLFIGFISFAQNNPPIANTDVDTVDFNTTLTVNATNGLLSNDTDADGDALIVTQFIINGTTYNAGSTAIIVGIATITINADGSFVIVPVAGYDGTVPDITYIISDGTDTSSGTLLLTVETDQDLLEITSITSCNQGYTASGDYKIIYSVIIQNKSIARDYNPNSLVTNISLKNNLQNVFGNGCVQTIDQISTSTSLPLNFVTNPYPQNWSNASSLNPNFENTTSEIVFTANAISANVLYPRQQIVVSYCVTVTPFCSSRPNPTPSGSLIDFDNIVTVSFTNGNGTTGTDTNNLEITDFHTTETTVAANFYVPETEPIVNFDGTYDYTNTVIITNDGTAIANNVNYNMGLGHFNQNGVMFTDLVITQVSGPAVTINAAYDGITSTTLLAPNTSLAAGETIILNVAHTIGVISSELNNVFSRQNLSMTQGALDGFDETLASNNPNRLSYVTWSDSMGNHLDTYYNATSATDIPSSNDQCICNVQSMRFLFVLNLEVEKTILNDELVPAASGIIENKDVTFNIKITNLDTSTVRLTNLDLIDDLSSFCTGHIVNLGLPTIVSTTAEVDPIINPLYNGQVPNTNIFDGNSGILNPGESITVQLTMEISDFCNSTNSVIFSGENPSGTNTNLIIDQDNVVTFEPFDASSSVIVNVLVDTDNDGISNSIDLDDDNDGIPDTVEYNGTNPSQDTDGDLTPDYLDTDAPGFIDLNADGINDVFDFDLDGILNHLDLDSDNDGIFDIIEGGNILLDINDNGRTEQNVGINGLDNTLETNDLSTATITYVIPNTDGSSKPNYLDIDSDADGIVDKIEGHSSNQFFGLNGSSNIDGVDTIYQNGIIITDTNGDGNIDFPFDKDGDLIPDYIDTDTDNDLRNDFIEGWDFDNDGIPETIALNTDSDNDGLDDAYDLVVNDGSQINATNNQLPTSFPNEDISSTPERDWRELIAPIITITDATIEEGGVLSFEIRLLSPSGTPITIDFSTEDQSTTIIADYDFATPIITFTIPTGVTTINFEIQTIDDNINELDSEFFLLNGTVTSLNTANLDLVTIGEILDNDNPPTVSINNPIVVEGELLKFVVSLDRANYTDVTLNIFSNNETARQPEDYLLISMPVVIPALSTNVAIDVTTIDDTLVEDIETMTLTGVITSSNTLNNPLSIIGIGTILDNDFPNLFSPNNDGFSDVFEIIALKPYGDFKLQIFDRWGSEVYNYNNNGNLSPIWWDGTYKGNPVPGGVYFYTLDYNDGVTKPKTGFIQLVR